MNVLLLLDRVPEPDECARTCVDTDWLLGLADLHGLVVAVDEASPGLSRLREAGITIHVSDKRHVYLPGRGLIDADEAFASWVTTQHGDRPFDLVVAAPERPLLGQFRSALPRIPWAVLAAAGSCASTHRLSTDPSWLRNYGHELWFAASNVVAGDVVISPVDPAVLGLTILGRSASTLLPVPEPDLRQHASGDLVVVAAMGVSHVDAAWRLESALEAIDVRRDTTIVVLHAPSIDGAEDLGAALAAGIPDGLDQQVILVPANREGGAGSWLATADALVLADTSELLIPAVARRAAVVPTVLLGDDRDGAARTTDLLSMPPLTEERPDVRLLQWTNPRQVAAELRSLRATDGLEMLVIHDEDTVQEATRWLDLEGLARFDVVLGAAERPPWGMPHLEQLDGGVVALHRRTWTAITAELTRGLPLPELIAGLADLAGARSHALGVVTVDRAPTSAVAPSRAARMPELIGGPLRDLRLPLPSPAAATAATNIATTTRDAEGRERSDEVPAGEALRTWARQAHWRERARLALPWRMGLADAMQEAELPDGVVRWARRHAMADRARLLLPWRWGLLPRAMEGRW